uniref:Uncharacterized protein n=1 Tax=Aegilops tauschii TaxID=37682 RepID=R7W8G0_AEGTA
MASSRNPGGRQNILETVVSERYSHGQGQQQSSLSFPFEPSMPRDFETYWEKDSENYKEGRELEPFQEIRDMELLRFSD